MPSHDDPRDNAADLSAAARALAYTTRSFPDPAHSYAVLGELQSAMFSLHQSVEQLANMHTSHRGRASTDLGNRLDGQDHATMAADHLRRAAARLDEATDELMAGFADNGTIAWLPQSPPTVREMLAERARQVKPEPTHRLQSPPPREAPGR